MRSPWIPRLRPILLASSLALAACTQVIPQPEFPRMSGEQVEAMGIYVHGSYLMSEWWVRYVKAWCKADGKTEAECAP